MLGWLVELRPAYLSYTGYVLTAFVLDSTLDFLPFRFYHQLPRHEVRRSR